MQDYGLDAPGVEKRQLEGKLWELKPDQHRLMYVMVAGRRWWSCTGARRRAGRRAGQTSMLHGSG
jgi:hypothetical protein